MESPFDDLGVVLDRIAAGECSETDVTTLRRMLFIGGEQNVVQVGKYNIRIGQGQDIQIGDRIYQGTDADAIQRILEPIVLQLREDTARLRQELLARLQGHGLTEEAAALPLDLRRHFDRLLQDYTFFGGRVNELATIESFLAEPQGGYLFVTGPSGYGKTALLVQMARQGNVVYHFLSRAYGTVDEDLFLRNLCRQLAARRGLGGQLPASIAELRALYPDLLRLPPAVNQPVVVLVDGLDEALNWEPGPQHFPPDLPNGVKVIFSGRQVADHDWPDHLRLPLERVQRLVLGAMTTHDLAALLRAAGGAVAPLAEDRAWIEQALQVSDGDPFYLKLLAEDLRDGRMQPGQIGEQPVGLDAYLRSWWNQVAGAVRARDVRDLLGTLAIARGRFQRNDLTAMFPDLGWALDGVLTEVRRFVIGGEQEGYTLCHPRFADYVRRRVGPRALETYTSALLVHCANWREHRSPYALQHLSDHLLETERFRELVNLIDRSFLSTKVQCFRSYTGALHDLRNAVHAARAICDPVKMLGLALVHSGLQTKVVQLATYDVIPLYARFGESERALEFAQSISDETQQAKTLVAVARELLPSDPNKARQIVRQVLANWQRYPAGYECGTILREVFSFLPDELVTFLEIASSFSPIYSLGHSSLDVTYDVIDQIGLDLDPNLQDRLRAVLERALNLSVDEQSKSELRFLLVRFEPDLAKAEGLAESEAAHIIAQGKRDADELRGGLSRETIDRAVRTLLEDALTHDERWTLLRSVIVPYAHQFIPFVKALEASEKKVHLLLVLGLALAEYRQDIDTAAMLLFDALQVDKEAFHLFDHPVISETSHPFTFRDLVKRVSAGKAVTDLQGALDFLKLPDIAGVLPSWDQGQLAAYAIGAAAQTDPEAALQAAERPWRYQGWAKSLIAETLAHTNLEHALSVWRELDAAEVDKPKVLMQILHNAPATDHDAARQVLEREFEPEQKYQLYKVPILLEIAAKLAEDQLERAKVIAENALDGLHDQFERERWSRPEREFFLVRIIPAVTRCGLVQVARGLASDITDDYGLQSVAAADMLRLLAHENSVAALSNDFDLTSRGLKGLAKLELARHALDWEIIDLHLRVSDPGNWGSGPSGGFTHEIADFAELLNTGNNAGLISLYLSHHAEHGMAEWNPDHVKALLAVKTVPFYGPSAWHFASRIRDPLIRQLAQVELYAALPVEVAAQAGGISNGMLQAIAFVRVAAGEHDPTQRQAWLRQAFAQAEEIAQTGPDEFMLDLLLYFVCEARQLDSDQTESFSRRLVELLATPTRAWAAHRLLELHGCGYTFSPTDVAAIEALSEKWTDDLEHLQDGRVPGVPLSQQGAHQLGSEQLTRVARSILPANRERGLRLVESAARHAGLVVEPNRRLRLWCSILKCLLAAGDSALWEEAVVRSLDYGDAVFHVFDRFCRDLLALEQGDSTLPIRLLETIDWAEDLMRV